MGLRCSGWKGEKLGIVGLGVIREEGLDDDDETGVLGGSFECK